MGVILDDFSQYTVLEEYHMLNSVILHYLYTIKVFISYILKWLLFLYF